MRRYFILMAFFIAGCAPVVYESTVDPNYGLALAEAQAARYEAQLTGTAQAFEMQIVGWTATAQSWTPTPSLTPMPTSTPTITFTPTVDVTGTLAVEKMQAEVTAIHLETQRKQTTNNALAVTPYVLGFFTFGLMIFLGYVGAKRLSMMPTPIHDATGKPQPMLNVLEGVVVDVDRMTNGAGAVNAKYLKALPLVTAERQDKVTAMAQAVDMQSRSKVTSEAVKRLMASQGVSVQPMLEAQNPPAVVTSENSFPLPSWDIARSWDGSGGLPYGIHAGGLGLVDLTKTPHTAVFGETGSGKSRRFLRPMITFALAAGMRVVILGKQVDFLPFASHPNAYILPVRELTLESEAVKYAVFLKAMVDEMGKRDAYLSSVSRSTWAQAGREMTLFVFDEYTNAMDLMPRQYAEETRRFARGLLREGRKYGFSMMLSAQRAVGLRDEVTQLGRAVFHVSDPQESRFALGVPGAESLREGYFMARFGNLNMAGAFEPTDAEIASFLTERRVAPLEPLPWLEGKFIEPTPEKMSLPEKTDIEKLAETIKGDWNPAMSGRQVAALLGKSYAGWWKDKTDEIIAVLKNQNLEGDMA